MKTHRGRSVSVALVSIVMLGGLLVIAPTSLAVPHQTLWIRQFGTASGDFAGGVATYGSSVYVSGWTEGTLPGQTSAGWVDAFLRKYDTDGNVLWTRQFGTSGYDSAGLYFNSVAADDTGAYVTGLVSGSLSGQPHAGSHDIFTRKYDPQGNEVWTRLLGTPDADRGESISVDATGVYVSGRTLGALPGQAFLGGMDAFVAKYSHSGSLLWTRQFGGTGYDWALGVSSGPSGLTVTGWVNGTGYSQPDPPTDAFLRKYDHDGNLIWERVFGGSSNDYGTAVYTSATDILVGGVTGSGLPGFTEGGGFLRRYDSTGNDLWTRQIGSAGIGTVTMDASGATYVGGAVGLALPGQVHAGLGDAFVRKYDAGGSVLTTLQFGSSSDDSNVYLSLGTSGLFGAGYTLGTLPGQTNLGGWDVYAVKLSLNTAPSISAFTAAETTEGSPTILSTIATDSDDDSLTYCFDVQNDGACDISGPMSSASYTFYDDVIGTARVNVSDGVAWAGATAPVTVRNVPPDVAITAPATGAVFPIGTAISFAGAFVDPGTLDSHTATWTFVSSSGTTTFAGTVSEVSGSGSVSDSFAFAAAGVYQVTLAVVDDDGGLGSATTVGGPDLPAFVVIYDPSGGFVTGGGWFTSPPGSYALDPMLSGKATFGFVSKYQKGKSLPTGETEFAFKVADFSFHSTSYDWLVCSGPKCQFKGHGTVNGVGGYSFLLSAIDGDLPGGGGQDKLRMKIWVTLTGQIVYDNQMGADDFADPTTVIGGGSIVIHKG